VCEDERTAITREIDSYITPCAIMKQHREHKHEGGHRAFGFSCMCKDPAHNIIISSNPRGAVLLPISSLFLLPQDELQYTSLPDMGVFIRATFTKKFFQSSIVTHHQKLLDGLHTRSAKNKKKRPAAVDEGRGNMCIHNSWGCALMQESIPCLNQSKRGMRNLHSAITPSVTELRACVHIMYGTLLKLYPRGSKTPTFTARVNLASRVREIMSLPPNEQLDFVAAHPFTVKMCWMEYCHNVLPDFFPVEYATISQQPCMKLYNSIVGVVFDTFRRDIMVTGLEGWDAMELCATSSIERCMRMCKFRVRRHADNPRSTSTTHAHVIDNDLMQMKTTHGDVQVLSRLYPREPSYRILAASFLHQAVVVYALPQCIIKQQQESISRLFGSCDFVTRAIQNVSVCLTCAINGKALKTKMRKCALSGNLMCELCKSTNILNIEILGVLLKVCNNHLFMCPICCKLRLWEGDGFDLSECRCVASSKPAKQICGCGVCGNKYIVGTPLLVTDVPGRRVVRVGLCIKHMPPLSIMNYVTDYSALQAAVRTKKGTRGLYSKGIVH
jgi:hypothetical protein